MQGHVAKMRERNKREESSAMEHAPDNLFEKNCAGCGRSWQSEGSWRNRDIPLDGKIVARVQVHGPFALLLTQLQLLPCCHSNHLQCVGQAGQCI